MTERKSKSRRKQLAELTPPADNAPRIETPVIDFQDLEHDIKPGTRVSNKGVKIEPRIGNDDPRLAAEDEAAIEALEELEQQMKQQPPG